MTDIDELARSLFAKDDPTGVWAAEDEITRIYYRRQAQERATAELYAKPHKAE